MKFRLFLIVLALLGGTALADDDDNKAGPFQPDDFLVKAVVGPRGDGTWVVPTTQLIRPAGKTELLPGRPVNVAISPDGQTLAVKNMSSLEFFDMTTQGKIKSLPFPEKQGASFCGLAWAPDGRRVWATTASDRLIGASPQNGSFQWDKEIRLPGKVSGARNEGSAPGGFALDGAGRHAYVALSINNTMGIVDLELGKLVMEIPVGIAPYSVQRVGDKLYVTNWGGRRPAKGDLTGPTAGSKAVVTRAGIASTGTVSVIDRLSGDQPPRVREIAVDLHPCGMAASPDGKRLYVANANSDTVVAIDTARDKVAARWSVKPMKELPLGSAPNALAVSRDGQRLNAALGGNNCLAAIDTASGRIAGLIPTGWYPGDVVQAQDGTLIVANTKGVGSRLRDVSPAQKEKYKGFGSHQHLGSVTFVKEPDTLRLQEYTFQVGANMRLPRLRGLVSMPKAAKRSVPVPTRPGEKSVFRHVIYIIKENRSYDQVFGDMKQGDGDPSLVQFGREVTPNHHALAEQFVLLDNFYCNGVLSADGHQWTNEGMVTDYLEKSFGGFTRSYPYEGEDAVAFAAGGFIWDQALKAGLTVRDYGEMVQATFTPRGATWKQVWDDYVNGTQNVKIEGKSPVRGLAPYAHPNVTGFPLIVPDVYRIQHFLKELREGEASGKWPNFIIMLLPNDHTAGTRPGNPTPRAMVADNDLALGQIVEAVSRSRFWKETAIFVVEDDPQAGLDHVDGHRTVALCVSPYTKRGVVEHTQYNQTGMLRTIELILGVGPLSQLTMAANPMVECFTEKPDLRPYAALKNNIPLDEMNPEMNALTGKARFYAQQSLELPLDAPDLADEDTFNRILWFSVKGDVPYPNIRNVEFRGEETE